MTLKERNARYYASHAEEEKEHRKNYYKENREAILTKNKEYRDSHKKEILGYHRAYRQKLRKNIIEHYGGKCACCGETTFEFLAIDHVSGNGKEQRMATGFGHKFYLWIISNNFPDSLQILCHNCNMSKGLYGKCPHMK